MSCQRSCNASLPMAILDQSMNESNVKIYLTSHSFDLSTLWDTGIHWNGCKRHHSGIDSLACSLVRTCRFDRLTTENRKCQIKGEEICDETFGKYKKENWYHTHASHNASQTNHWRRSSRRDLVGRSEAPCNSCLSDMIAGSFGQTFLLCRLKAREI